MAKLKTIDLFAGIGGIRIAFEKAGFETTYANDFDEYCKSTYDFNFNNPKLDKDDIWNVVEKDLPKFDILLAGFPCQAFSIAGYRKGFEDEQGRGNLFFALAKLIKKYQPKAFLLENVKNLYSHDKGRTFLKIKDVLENELNYHIGFRILNSMEYGNVPQNRERVYIVGFKNKQNLLDFNWPKEIILKKQIKDILEKDVDQKYYYEGKPLYERIKNYDFKTNTVYQWRRQYIRENKKGVCPTLTANMGTGGHNVPIIKDKKGIRKLTPQECLRIQGFPANYKFPETLVDSKKYKQIGNSVTVTVLARIAYQIEKTLNIANKAVDNKKIPKIISV
jgi:DNA (cytosine-5)-methyltransferase 1